MSANKLENKKLKVEWAKVLEGALRTLFFMLATDIGGVITLVLNIHKYNSNTVFILISLGIFTGIGLVYSIVVLILELIKIRKEIGE